MSFPQTLLYSREIFYTQEFINNANKINMYIKCIDVISPKLNYIRGKIILDNNYINNVNKRK